MAPLSIKIMLLSRWWIVEIIDLRLNKINTAASLDNSYLYYYFLIKFKIKEKEPNLFQLLIKPEIKEKEPYILQLPAKQVT